MQDFFNNIYFRKAGDAGGAETPTQESGRETEDKAEEEGQEEQTEAEGPSWWESAKSKVGLESEDYYEDLEKQIEAGEIENETAEEVSEGAKNRVEAEMEEPRDEVENSVEDLDNRGADTSEMEDLEDELEEFIEETTERIDDIFVKIQSEGGEESKGRETSEETPTTDEVIDELEEERRTELEAEEEPTAKEGGVSEPEAPEESEQTETERVNVNAQLEKMSYLYESKDRLESIVEESTNEEEVQAAKDNLDRINNRIDNIVDNLRENTDMSDEEILERFEEIHTGKDKTKEQEIKEGLPFEEGQTITIKNEDGNELIKEFKIKEIRKTGSDTAEDYLLESESGEEIVLDSYQVENWDFEKEQIGEEEEEKARSVELPRKLMREAMVAQGESEEIIDALIEGNTDQAKDIVENLFDNLSEEQQKRLQESLQEQGWEVEEFIDQWKEEIAGDVVEMYQQEVNKKIQEKVQEQMTWSDKLKSGWKDMSKKAGLLGGSMAAGAAAGGTAGSVFGPLGTTVGAVMGARFGKGAVDTAAESGQALTKEEGWEEEEEAAKAEIAEAKGYTEEAKTELKAEMRTAFDTDRQYMLADTINQRMSKATEKTSLMEKKNEILKEKAKEMREQGMEEEAINTQLEILSNELDQAIVDALKDGRSFMDAAIENGASEQAVEILSEEGFGEMPEAFKDSDTEKTLKRFGIPTAAGATTAAAAGVGGPAGAYMTYGAGKGMEVGARIGEKFDKSEVSEEMQDRIEVIQTQITNRLDKYSTEEEIKNAITEELVDDLVKIKGALDNGIMDEKVVEEFDVVKEADAKERTRLLQREISREINNRKLENLDEKLSEVEQRVEEEVEEQTSEAAEVSGREDVEYILPEDEEKKGKILGGAIGALAGTVIGGLIGESGGTQAEAADADTSEATGGASEEGPRKIDLGTTEITGEVPKKVTGEWVEASSGDGLESLASKSFENLNEAEKQKVLDTIGAEDKEGFMDYMREEFKTRPEYDIEYAGDEGPEPTEYEGGPPETAKEVEHGSMVYAGENPSEFKISVDDGRLEISDKNIGEIGESHEWTVSESQPAEVSEAAEKTEPTGMEDASSETEATDTDSGEVTEGTVEETTEEVEEGAAPDESGESTETSREEAEETSAETGATEEEAATETNTEDLPSSAQEAALTGEEIPEVEGVTFGFNESGEVTNIEIPNQVEVSNSEIEELFGATPEDPFVEMDVAQITVKDRAYDAIVENMPESAKKDELLSAIKEDIASDLEGIEDEANTDAVKEKYGL